MTIQEKIRCGWFNGECSLFNKSNLGTRSTPLEDILSFLLDEIENLRIEVKRLSPQMDNSGAKLEDWEFR